MTKSEQRIKKRKEVVEAIVVRQEPVHIISAWSHSHGITLGSMRSEGKKNEIETLPKLIDMLETKGATITIDAMGCQKDIIEKVIANGSHYIFQLKANQSSLFEEVKAYHHKLERDGYGDISISECEEVDKGHGRLEVRRYQHFELSNWVENKKEWKGTTSIIR